jgi:exopolysaccharide biosynthesis polyprenyl glycosylphosphotransferase
LALFRSRLRQTRRPQAGAVAAAARELVGIEGAVSVQEQFAETGHRNAIPVLPAPFVLAPLAEAKAKRRPAPRFYGALKRMLDLLIAVPAMAFASPLLLVVALLVAWDSKGPVVFRQKRLGLNGRPFGILKFRTMSVVEDGERVVQAARNDARVTRIGRLLRATSLDELPQLINVIRGEMSLVGPRPHAAAHDALYSALIPEYNRRQSVKPGITGWAQVNGLRGGTPTLDLMQKRVDLDIWYAGHASLWLDLAILLRTPLEIIRRRNAY